MDGGDWRATVLGVAKELDLTEQLTQTHIQYLGTVAHLYFQRNGPRADQGPQVCV